MFKFEQLEKEIEQIKERNSKVELDKAWELSFFRKIIISALIYIVVVIFFCFIDLKNSFINAIVPALGFFLSNLSISIFKKFWIKYFYKKKITI